MNVSELNGYQVYGFFRSGSQRLGLSRKRLNDINVFPVADRDTGSNMAATLAGAVELALPHASASRTLTNLAEAALESARGNSGVILAQFMGGLSETASSSMLKLSAFVLGVERAVERAREAISHPRDGTMLSVMQDWAMALRREHGQARSFDELFQAAKPDLHVSLESTRTTLPEMRQAGVVDAGASGFVEFVEGAHEFLKLTRNGDQVLVAEPAAQATPGEEAEHAGHELLEPPIHRYCTEAMLAGTGLDPAAIRKRLEDLGDSLIVATGPGRVRVHIHSDEPDRVMAVLAGYGAVSRQKVDDMRRQFEDAAQRHDAAVNPAASRQRLALVTDSACDLPSELLDRHGIHVLPMLLKAGDGEYLDKLTLAAPEFWRLAERAGSLPQTSQPSAGQFARLHESLVGNFDAVLAVHVAGAMSGTFRAAQTQAALDERGGLTSLAIDSRHLSASLGLLVLRVAEAARAGAGMAELAARIPQWSAKARIFVSVSSLRYMVRGGRVSPLKGAAARLLNLKPIVSVDAEGKSILYGKSFSEKANLAKLVAMTRFVHAEKPLRSYAVVHANAAAKAASLAATLERELGFPPLYVMEISSVIALNAGPGAVSVALMSE